MIGRSGRGLGGDWQAWGRGLDSSVIIQQNPSKSTSSVIELLFLSLTVEALQGKPCQTRSLQEWVGHLEPKFQGEGVVLGNIFWFLQN